MKLTINRNLHTVMKEISRRRRRDTGETIGRTYTNALKRYVDKEKLPKRVEKIMRQQFRFGAPPEMQAIFEACTLIAKKRNLPVVNVIEQALTEYIEMPDNFLGKAFYRGIKREFME